MQIKCECGNEDDTSRFMKGDLRQRMESRNLCFNCSFWWEKVEWEQQGQPWVVRVDGVHRTIGPDPKPGTPGHCFGHGGHRFVFRFHDGRVVESRNVWHQGDIPERFRELLPDNAVMETGW